ncbi:hypothetical protein [Aestuariivirga sp.]|jgi:hypothetical protein|uniref:hypothetical protein n=1 Tax=Aestuariivirga sp. TaxID=2650926 RepID=UPI0037836383
MKTLIWSITAAAVVLWSGFAWFVHGLVGVAGGLAAGNADIIPADPLVVEWASWIAMAGTGIGEWLVVAVWAIITLALLGFGFAAAVLGPRLKTALPLRS